MVAAVTAGIVVVAAYVLFLESTVAEWTYLAVVVLASAGAWIGATRAGTGWIGRSVAIGVLLAGIGDVIWQGLVWSRGEAPDVSVADIAWLAAYVALGGALLQLLRGTDRRRLDVDGLIDMAVVVVVVMLIQWELAIHELVTDASVPVFVRFIWALYPALDAVLLALVLRAVVARRLRGLSALLLGGGVVCWLASDFAYNLMSTSDDYSVWLDGGWLLASILLATAARQTRAATVEHAPADDAAHDQRVGYARFAVALLPLLVPGLIEVAGDMSGQEPDSAPLFVGSVALIALAFVRAGRLLRAEADARATIRSQERYAQAIALRSSDAVAVLDANGTVISESRLAALVGYPERDLVGADVIRTAEMRNLEEVQSVFARSLLHPGQTFETEVSVEHRDGRDLWLSARMSNLVHDPDVGGVVVNLHDVTDRKRVEEQLAHQAFHDGLTGLANRALFHDRIEQALRRNERTGLDVAVVFLDLDGFKTVNDSLGHSAGDELLREVATRLAGAIRAGDTVARLGGDEFAILIEQSPRSADEAHAVSERAMQALSVPIALGDQLVSVSASIGIAVSAPDTPASSLLRDADVAMYRAKAAGKSRAVMHDPAMRTDAVERLQLQIDLRTALDAGQLALVYQPVVELESEGVIGFEALLRWHHPTLGTIAPARFVPIAEETGVIVDIGRWVLEEACRTAAGWHAEHPHLGSLTVSVNVSGHQISTPAFQSHVEEALRSSGLDPSALVLEMTETALVRDTSEASRQLQALRRLGVRLAIDDFGTGYSSLNYLRQFPVDIIKIDRSFVSSISEEDEVPAIVRGLLELGRTLDVATVAEGVERDDQRDSLLGVACEFAQGFLFAKPLEPSDVTLLLLGLPPDSTDKLCPEDDRAGQLPLTVVEADDGGLAGRGQQGAVLGEEVDEAVAEAVGHGVDLDVE